jgi:hypothetical protein
LVLGATTPAPLFEFEVECELVEVELPVDEPEVEVPVVVGAAVEAVCVTPAMSPTVANEAPAAVAQATARERR